jgi:hypothetical protein
LAILPFGTKAIPDQWGRGGTPDRVDFNLFWGAAVRPALEALGYEAVRADVDTGALILGELLERLILSDLVLIDITLPDPMAYYQAGIRHAAAKGGCVLMSAEWARPAVDMATVRQIRYRLNGGFVSPESAEEIRIQLQEAIPILAAAPSPVHLRFPGYGTPTYSRHSSAAFRQRLEELSEFQSAVQAVKCAHSPLERRRLALAVRDQWASSGGAEPSVALGILFLLRDSTDWKTMLEFIESMPPDIRSKPVVQEQWALARSKAGDTATAIAALQELIEMQGETSERRGLLGGRYRKLWIQSRNPEDLDLAIFEYERGMMLDLNDYYPSSNLPRLYRIRGKRGDDDRARMASAVTLLACERARKRGMQDDWLLATLLGAAFDAGDVEKASSLAEEISAVGPATWKLASTISDLRLSISFHDPSRAHELEEILAGLERLS